MMHRTPAAVPVPSRCRPGARALARALALTACAAWAPAQGLHIGPTADPAPTHQPASQPPAQGGHIRPPIRQHGVYIKSLTIKARIVDGVATTQLSQVFHNSGSGTAEGTWILPLPEGATADGFTMTMNGKQVSGEICGADQARQVYTSIVRRQRDPGLLEYMGNGCLRARVFPILPKQDMVVEVRYRQVLPATAGVHHWRFPLRNAHVSGRPADELHLDVSISSQKAIKNVYSPSQGIDVARKDDHNARISLEQKGGRMATRDLDVFYGLSDQEFGLNLLTHRKQGESGYFVMMLSPKLEWDESKALPKCVNFVLDTSGSMNGKKIEQARAALKFFVGSMKKQDYFNVIPFSTEARPFFESPVPADAEHVKKAHALAAELTARGGTNIEQGLAAALQAPLPEVANLVAITVFLTDGRPTVDTTDTEQLLALVRKHNGGKQQVFVFGVGHDVNTTLLDKLAAQHRGDRDYVREEEDIEVKTGALFTKLSHPVMSGVDIRCEGIEGFDVFPKTTPDLFKGSRLMLTGRYKGSGHHAIRLKGVVDGAEKTFVYEGSFPETSTSHDFIPTLWAQRKVAVLLDAIRLNGTNKELIDEIKRLGNEHGIVTPYTSNLILEEGQRISRFTRYRGPGDATPGGARTNTGSDVFYMGPSRRVAEELRRAGVVDGKDAEKKVAREMAKPRANAGGRGGRGDGAGAPPAATGPTTLGPGAPGAPAGGKAAVDYSLALRTLQKQGSVRDSREITSRHIQGHTFHLIGGVWIDGKLKPGMEEKAEKVTAFSDEYFALVKAHPELAKIFAFSTRIVVVLDKRVIEVAVD